MNTQELDTLYRRASAMYDAIHAVRERLWVELCASRAADRRKALKRRTWVWCVINYQRTGQYSTLPAYGEKVEIVRHGRLNCTIRTRSGATWRVRYKYLAPEPPDAVNIKLNRELGGFFRG